MKNKVELCKELHYTARTKTTTMNEANATTWSSENSTSSQFNLTGLPTVSSPSGDHISASVIGVSTMLLVFAAVSAVANFLVLLSYKFEKKLRSNFVILIVNQAVADFIVSIIPMTLYTVNILVGYWPFGRALCGLWVVVDYGATLASVYALVAICVDRLWATKWCHHYRKYNTRKKVGLMCLAVWVATVIVIFYPLIRDRVLRTIDYDCKFLPDKNPEFVIAMAFVGHHVPCVIIVICYGIVYYEINRLIKTRPQDRHANTARRKPSSSVAQTTAVTTKVDVDKTTQQGGSNEEIGDDGKGTENGLAAAGTSKDAKNEDIKPGAAKGNGEKSQAHGNKVKPAGHEAAKDKQKGDKGTNKRRKTFITLTYIVLAYMVCWVPFHFVFDVSLANPEIVPEDLYTAAFWMTYVNSGLNPWMYAFSSADFRKAVVQMLKFRYCRGTA